MSNWIKGSFRARGPKENIKKFIMEGLGPIGLIIGEEKIKKELICEDDEFLEFAFERTDDGKGRLYKRCWDLEWIYELPAVKLTRKRGKWIKYCSQRAGEQHYQCTNCKKYVNFGMWGDYYTKDFKYCPHCGAEME